MSKRDASVPLRHMLDHARKALELSAGRSRTEIQGDELRYLALARLLEILGEAASRVPQEVRARHTEVPWKAVVGLRNVLIHGYDSIDDDIIWRVLSKDLPELVPALERVVAAETRPS